MLTVTRRFTFDAAHILPNHPGLCSNLHGHTYILEVTVKGVAHAWDNFVNQGFFIDLGELKGIVKEVLTSYDHQNLNAKVDEYPTAERLIMRLWVDLIGYLPSDRCQLVHLRLHETPDSWVEYDGGDANFPHQSMSMADQQRGPMAMQPSLPMEPPRPVPGASQPVQREVYHDRRK